MSLETWSRSRSRDVSRDPFFGVSVSGLEGLQRSPKVSEGLRRSPKVSEGLRRSVSASKYFGLGLELFVSRLCIGYFYEVLQEGVP